MGFRLEGGDRGVGTPMTGTTRGEVAGEGERVGLEVGRELMGLGSEEGPE